MDILCLDVFFESFNNNFRWLSIQFWISRVGFFFKFGIEGNQIIELLSWSFSNVRDVIIKIDIVSLLKLNIFICSLILMNISFVLLGCRLSKIGKISDQKSTYLPIGNLWIMLNCQFLISLFTKSMQNFCLPTPCLQQFPLSMLIFSQKSY